MDGDGRVIKARPDLDDEIACITSLYYVYYVYHQQTKKIDKE